MATLVELPGTSQEFWCGLFALTFERSEPHERISGLRIRKSSFSARKNLLHITSASAREFEVVAELIHLRFL